MLLSPEDAEQFIRLHQSLLFFINQRLEVIDEPVPSLEAYKALSAEVRLKVHKVAAEHTELIDAFLDADPFHLDEAGREIVRSWKHQVSGTFYAFRQLKNYMVFLSAEQPVVAYGVVALTDPIEDILGPDLPRMVKTSLMPFNGRIVYSGMMSGYNVSFGPGIRRSLNESYKRSKALHGIITTLPPPAVLAQAPGTKSAAARARKPRKASATKAKAAGGSAAAPAREAHERVMALIDEVCAKHLDEEYATLSRKLADVLARKRPSPLVRGRPESWACGIVRVIGWANFISDPSKRDHLRLTDIDTFFGVSEATGAAKSMAIRNMLRIRRLDPEWTLPSRMEKNPLAWLIEVNGLPVDVRHLPRPMQEAAFRRGLIPYIPGDRTDESEN